MIVADRDPLWGLDMQQKLTLPHLQNATAYTFTRQLVRDRRVDDATYARVQSMFGVKGLVDMVHLIGFYLTTCALLNAFDIPAPLASWPHWV